MLPSMPFVRRIFFYFIGISLLSMSVGCILLYQQEKKNHIQQLTKQLTKHNAIVKKYLQNKNNIPNIQSLAAFFPDTTLKIIIKNNAGNVLFNNFNTTFVKDFSVTNNRSVHHLSSKQKTYLYLTDRFHDGYIATAMPLQFTFRDALKSNSLLINWFLFIFFVCLVVLIIILSKYAQSLKLLTDLSQKSIKESAPHIKIEISDATLNTIAQHIGILQDANAQNKEALKKEHERLLTHIQFSHEGIGIFSSDKKEIFANKYFIQYINMLSDKRCEKSDEIFAISVFETINKFIDRNLLHKKANDTELIIEQNLRIFALRCVVFEDGVFEIFINDISVQGHENALKRDLTQNISHELKTPISSILGYLESMLENPNIDPTRQRFFMERSYLQAKRLSALLQDISTLNKMDETKRLFEKEYCNISEIVTDVLNDTQLEMEKKQCKAVKHIAPEVNIVGNRSLLYSIFRNLLDNALAYAGEQVTIEILCYFHYFHYLDVFPM